MQYSKTQLFFHKKEEAGTWTMDRLCASPEFCSVIPLISDHDVAVGQNMAVNGLRSNRPQQVQRAHVAVSEP